jgi:hypothetical protein
MEEQLSFSFDIYEKLSHDYYDWEIIRGNLWVRKHRFLKKIYPVAPDWISVVAAVERYGRNTSWVYGDGDQVGATFITDISFRDHLTQSKNEIDRFLSTFKLINYVAI